MALSTLLGQMSARPTEGASGHPQISTPEKATLRQWIVVTSGVFAALMAIFEIGISNSSLQAIQSSLATSLEETSWIPTSYLIGEIIAVPLAGWFAQVFTIRRYLLFNAVAFTIFSLLCGTSTSLNQMIILRFFQGFAGGCFIPLGMNIVMTVLPLSQRSIGILIFSLSSSLGPVIGPNVGGWISYHYDWRYAYFIQIIPCGLLCASLYFFMESQKPKLEMLKNCDWSGIILASVGLGLLTYVLEDGNRYDWFSDASIAMCFVIGLSAMIAFVVHETRTSNPFINLRLYRNRNFLLTSIANLLFGTILLSNPFVQSRYLIQIHNYDTLTVGKFGVGYGLGQFAVIPLIPSLAKKISRKALAIGGLFCILYWAIDNTGLDYNYGIDQFFWPQFVRGLGTPFIMTTLTALAYLGISKKDVGSASGLFSAHRQLGGSLGIAISGIVLDMRYRFHFSKIASVLHMESQQLEDRLLGISETFSKEGMDGREQALKSIWATIHRDALIMSYSDVYYVLIFVLIVIMGILLLLHSPSPSHDGR